jgi:hypothetical protein
MRTAVFPVLMLAAASASADWVKVYEAGGTAYYVDPASVVVQGGVRRTSVIHDYAQPQPGAVRSRRVTYDIDCAGERLRSVSASEYAEPMSQGKALNAWERESEWAYVGVTTGSSIAPRTPYRPIVKFVCSR